MFVIISVSACDEVSSPDGRLPDGVQGEFEKYLGAYEGEFDGNPGEIELSVDADRKVVMSFTDASGGHSLLGSGCDLQIGQMNKYKVNEDHGKYSLKYLGFYVSKNECDRSIVGNTLYVHFKLRSGLVKVEASLLEKFGESSTSNCVDAGGRTICWTLPGTPDKYIWGAFTK